jgi:hypothetical protein
MVRIALACVLSLTTANAVPTVTVYTAKWCGLCHPYIQNLRSAGIIVEEVDSPAMAPLPQTVVMGRRFFGVQSPVFIKSILTPAAVKADPTPAQLQQIQNDLTTLSTDTTADQTALATVATDQTAVTSAQTQLATDTTAEQTVAAKVTTDVTQLQTDVAALTPAQLAALKSKLSDKHQALLDKVMCAPPATMVATIPPPPSTLVPQTRFKPVRNSRARWQARRGR